MDNETINFYNNNAKEIAEKYNQFSNDRLLHLADTFFNKNSLTLDLGCGPGRDLQKLKNHFELEGVDASAEFIKIAKKNNPEIKIFQDFLPSLSKIQADKYDNVFCSAVLMHIPKDQHIQSVINLLRITKINGVIMLSFRNKASTDTDDRLFESINSNKLISLFESLGGKVLFQETQPDQHRTEIEWHTIIIKKIDNNTKDGIFKIQDIISKDKKTSTYKLALLRSLCYIAKYEPNVIYWHKEVNYVYIPLRRVAIRFLTYYWNFVKQNIKQTTSKKLAFNDAMMALDSDLMIYLNELENNIENKSLDNTLKKIAETIKNGPLTYITNNDLPLFPFVSASEASLWPDVFKDSDLGAFAVPYMIWRDLLNFNHWIDSSLVMEWAELSKQINKSDSLVTFLDILTRPIYHQRDTYIVRKLFEKKKVECVWSGVKINQFDIDHTIPYSVWKNNDLWNLLPTASKVNNNKRDKIPTLNLLKKRKEIIFRYWDIYNENFPEVFSNQLQRSLCDGELNYTNAFHGLIETCERLVISQGLERWEL
jgi:SAM-dependent methyltransferase